MTPRCDARKCSADADSWVIVAGRHQRLCHLHIDRARSQVGDGVTVLYDAAIDAAPPSLLVADASPTACAVPGCAVVRKSHGLCQRHYNTAHRANGRKALGAMSHAAAAALALTRPPEKRRGPPRPKKRTRPPNTGEMHARYKAALDVAWPFLPPDVALDLRRMLDARVAIVHRDPAAMAAK